MSKKKNNEFKILSKKEEKELSKEELIKYYKALREYYKNNRWIENLTIEQRNKIHKFLVPLFKFNTLINGQKVVNIDKAKAKDKLDPNRSTIFVINHVGKFDVEKVGEVIKEPFFLLSGDFENLHGTIDGLFIDVNGIIYYDMNVKEEYKCAKEDVVNMLNNGGNVKVCIEQTWNFSPNKLVLDSKYGVIDIARETNSQILPIGILQYGKKFYVKIGDVFEVNKYFDEELDQHKAKKNGIRDLRDELATLMWDIMEYDLEKNGQEDRNELVNSKYWEKYVEDRLSEWTFTLDDVLSKEFFDPDVVREEDVYSFIEDMKKDWIKVEFNSENNKKLTKKR